MQTSEAINRIKKYCAEAEKCTQDVIDKLTEWGVEETDIQEILSVLKTEGFLVDERYAKHYVSEKLNLDKWGRIKIENALRQKCFTDDQIEVALNDIDDQDYIVSLHEILVKKYREVKSEEKNADAKRVMMHALSKGYEEELVEEWIEKNILTD